MMPTAAVIIPICHYRLKAVSKASKRYNPNQNKEDIRISDDTGKRTRKSKNTEK